MGERITWTDVSFRTVEEAWKCIEKEYTTDNNTIMRNMRKAGVKISAKPKWRSGRYFIVIIVKD